MNYRQRKKTKKVGFFSIFLVVLIFCPALPAQRRGMRPPPDMPIAPFTATQPAAAAQPENKTYTLKFHVDEAGLTTDIVNCPLQTALEELAERTGIIFEVRSLDNYLVSLHLKEPLNLTAAIKRIANRSNTVFVYSNDESSPQLIKMVKILTIGSALPQPSVVYLGTGVITKKNDEIETPGQAIKILQEGKEIGLREKAIVFLVSESSEGAGEALVNCISDQAPEIRVAAIEGLAALNERNALPAIVKTLKDANSGVRQSAVTAISMLGDYTNIKDLKPLSTDKDPNVVAAAEMAVRKLSITIKR
jgi:hypothetical protein